MKSLILIIPVLFLFACGSGNESSSDVDEEAIVDEVLEEGVKAREELAELTDGSTSVLSNADIDRYIETIVPMMEEIEALGHNVETSEEELRLKEIFQQEEVVSIAEKYGWNEDFGEKYMTISMGIGYLAMEEQINNLPEDQREAYKNMIADQFEEYKNMVNEKDMELLKERLPELMEVITQMD